jgi:leader peptidase (prepilin peptidase) / N-methyltransferase
VAVEGVVVLDAILVLLCAFVARTDRIHGIIPDWCNALIALLGLIWGLLSDRDIVWSLMEAMLVFALFFLLRVLYRRLRGHNGLGLGDVKFLAAATMRTGLSDLHLLVFAACLSGLLEIALRRSWGERITPRSILRFGPHLALGFTLVLALQAIVALT